MNMERPFTINMKPQHFSKYIRPLIEAGVAGYAVERIWNKTKHPQRQLVWYIICMSND